MFSSWEQCLTRPEVLLMIEGQEVAPLACEADAHGVVLAYPYDLSVVGRRRAIGDVVEWRWSIENKGATASPPVTAFRPLRLTLPCQGRHAPTLHGTRGGLDDANFPPLSWAQWRKCNVTEGLAQGYVAASSLGRSSNQDAPFFVLQEARGDSGYYLALGWSGDWELSMRRKGEEVEVLGGMPHLNLSLLPGETFLQPTVLIGRYSGTPEHGQRALRRYLRDHVQPSLAGQPMAPVTFFDNYYGDRGNFDADAFLREIPIAAQVGIDYLVIDGGWSGGGYDANFRSLIPFIGSWAQPDPRKFPQGFSPLIACAQHYDRKLGIWFDIEHAHPTSLAMRQHPELFFGGPLDDLGCQLLRLDTQSGVDWALETMSQAIHRLEARWLRFDFNSNPAPIWQYHDTPQRRGAGEIRYVEGLYRLMDALLLRFPDMVIENCASGGRRIDLETLRRSHTNWVSDHSQSEAVIRFHIHGAARWLPANHINTGMAHRFLEPHRPVNWAAELPASAYLSHFGGNYNISDRAADLDPAGRSALERYIALWSATAAAFAGDVYPLGEQDDTVDGPAGLAAVDPSTGRRAVVTFGQNPAAISDWVPEEFRSLVYKCPLLQDAGSDQFVCSTLWMD